MISGISSHAISTVFSPKPADGGKVLPHSKQATESIGSDQAFPNLETVAALSSIAQKYDVRSMSPREMASMSQELFQRGFISYQDHALMSFQPDLGHALPGAVQQPDMPLDFIAHWERQLQVHAQRGETSFAANDRKILSLLGNLEVLA